jgi:hypothetical protein
MPVKAVLALLLLLSIGPAIAAETCTHERGEDRADGMVAQCKAASSSSNPTCNPDNSCDAIEAAVHDGCAQRKQRHASVPSFCGRY